MKLIPLTKGYVAQVDDEDYDRASRYSWSACVLLYKGTVKKVYGMRRLSGGPPQKFELLHRFILDVQEGALQVDHIDNDSLNCKRGNLRIATRSQNQGNSKIRRHNKSGVKGVSWNPRNHNWTARLSNHKGKGKSGYIGSFATKEEAQSAYDKVAKWYFGEFARSDKRSA